MSKRPSLENDDGTISNSKVVNITYNRFSKQKNFNFFSVLPCVSGILSKLSFALVIWIQALVNFRLWLSC